MSAKRRDEQKLLCLSPEKRVAAWRALEGVDPLSVGLTRRTWARVVELIKHVEYTTKEHLCRASVELLAAKMGEGCGVSRATLLRASAVAQNLGLLNVQRRSNRRGRETNLWQVQWDRVEALGGLNPGELKALEVEVVHVPLDSQPRSDTLARRSDTLARPKVANCNRVSINLKSGKLQNETIQVRNIPPVSHCVSLPPPSPSDDPGDARDDPTGWGRVVEELKAERVSCADDAAAAFRSAGGTSGDALEIINAYRGGLEPRPPAWEPGALFHRLKHGPPAQDPRDGWPKPNPDHVIACKQRDAEQRRHETFLEEARQRQQRSSMEAELRLDREARDKRDAAARRLPLDELRQLIRSIKDEALRRRGRDDPYSPAVLFELRYVLGCEDLVTADPRGSPSPN